MAIQGDLHPARSLLSAVVAEAEADRDRFWELSSQAGLGIALALLGQPEQARAAAERSITIAGDLGMVFLAATGYISLALAAMAAGDIETLRQASQTGWRLSNLRPEAGVTHQVHVAEAALAAAELPAARQHAAEAIATATRMGLKSQKMRALLASARAATAADDVGQAQDDAYQALTIGHSIQSQPGIVEALECLCVLAGAANTDQHRAARLLGAAHAVRRKTGYQRFLLHQDGYDAAVARLRSSVGDAAFTQEFDQGAALTLDDAVSYALRGRGQRSRPAIGWLSLTPAERDVARLVAEGLANKEIAARLFVSPRTVQTHLTHMYGKLGITSRVQLAQEAARQV